MFKKILSLLTALTVCLVLFASCGNNGEADTQADAAQSTQETETEEVTAEEAAAEEDGQNPVMNFVGPYQADRCSLLIQASGEKDAIITASWGNSLSSSTEWTMTATFDEDTLRLNYSDCEKKTVEYNANGDIVSEDVEYTNGSGRIQLFDDGTLRWENEEEPETFQGMTFTFLAQ